MRLGVLLLVLFCCGVCVGDPFCPDTVAVPGDRRADKTRLRVVEFNVEFLFLERSNPNWETMEERMEHIRQVAEVIDSLDGDVIVLPEIENCDVLKVLIDMLSPSIKDSYLPYAVKGKDSATGQDVGLITRIDPTINLMRTEERYDYPMFGSECGYTTEGTQGVSKHFYTSFHLSELNMDILLIGLHFLAFPTDKMRCSKREAQARVIRDIIVNEGFSKNRQVLVMGDYNDYDNVVVDAAGSEPNSKVLQIIKGAELSIASLGYPDASEIYTGWWDKNRNCIDDGRAEHTMIDHILLSEELKHRISSVEFVHTFEAGCDSMISDHWPVVVEFKTGGTKAVVTNAQKGEQLGNGGSDSGVWIAIVVGVIAGAVVGGVVFVGVVWVWRRRRNAELSEGSGLLV